MEPQQLIQRIEELTRKVEAMADPQARADAVELLQSLMEFHGAGLERMMEITAQRETAGESIINDFAGDELVGGMLLLYGLHPVALEERVMQALDKVRPYLHSHGGNVEVLGIDDGTVRLRLEGSCKSCPSSSMTLKLAIEEAIYEAAPDVAGIEAEGVLEPPAPTGFVPLGRTRGEAVAAERTEGNGWNEVSGLATLGQGDLRTVEVAGRALLFCRLEETFYAYRSLCPRCGQGLQAAYLEANNIVCNACGGRYDCVRAGLGLDHPGLQLEPFPLLMEQGRAKVALPHPVTS
ncbi:MAG TPA: NifU family protein [Pyrinomonadaceae bacterium]|jgi:Fe-S cluster biogenesis protein NfuA/nitrite reductase/ring-hydroxylating ferredoxin subunit